MEKSKALEFIEKNKIRLESYKTVIVTSDNAVYLDSELGPIEEHCNATGKTFCVVKSDQVKEEEKSAPEIESNVEVLKSDFEPLPELTEENKKEEKVSKPKSKK